MGADAKGKGRPASVQPIKQRLGESPEEPLYLNQSLNY